MSSHTAVAYLQVIPEFTTSGDVYSVKVVKMTQRIPADPDPYARVVKVRVQLDDALFAILPVNLTVENDEANPVGTSEVLDVSP